MPRYTPEPYDPNEEQVRAQRQAIYESIVKRALGKAYDAPFRTRSGRRIDLRLSKRQRESILESMFQIGTGVEQKHGFLRKGTQDPTRRTALDSYERYQNPDMLVRNRQDYEETLALSRKNFYRVTPEPTRYGVKYFVWPMPPGCRQPGPATDTMAESVEIAEDLNDRADPRRTNKWWKPPKKKYTKRELSYWLPPKKVFDI